MKKKKKLIITPKTKWADIAIYWDIVSRETKEQFYKQVQRYYNLALWEMTIKQLYKLLRGEPLLPLNDTAFCQIFYFAVHEWAEQFINVINSYTPKEGGNTGLKMTFAEAVLIEMQQYFFCRSFAEVEQLRVSDYILMKKAKYNTYLQEQMAIKKIQQQKKYKR